jgi:hypothetical protein
LRATFGALENHFPLILRKYGKYMDGEAIRVWHFSGNEVHIGVHQVGVESGR